MKEAQKFRVLLWIFLSLSLPLGLQATGEGGTDIVDTSHLKFFIWQKNGVVVGYELDEHPNVTINTEAFVLTTTDMRLVYAPGDIVRFTLEDVNINDPTTLGDVNGDATIDLTDAIMIVYYSLGQKQAGFNEVLADVNNDGNIDLTDAITVVYKSLGAQ